MDVINCLKNVNAEGVVCLSTKIITSIRPQIAGTLADITNYSVETETFPSNLKIGMVTPIHKKDSLRSIDNYRPITVEIVLCKVIEKCVYKEMFSFLKKYNVMSDHQHGFLPGRSTESASIALLTFIHTSLDRTRYVGALFFDLSKVLTQLLLT